MFRVLGIYNFGFSVIFLLVLVVFISNCKLAQAGESGDNKWLSGLCFCQKQEEFKPFFHCQMRPISMTLNDIMHE